MTQQEFIAYGEELPVEPWVAEDRQLLVTLTHLERSSGVPAYKGMDEHWIVKGIRKRLELMRVRYTIEAVLFLVSKFQSIGMSVMLLHYILIKRHSARFNMQAITEVFPTGCWSAQDCEKFYRAQKLPSDKNTFNQLPVNAPQNDA